jgi:EPS-associated MarR family transcriptional regulator
MSFERACVVQICLYNMAVASLIFCSQLFFLHLMNRKDIHLDLLRKLEVNPEYTQRELSQEMGVSLGKINYCMKKLIEKGWIKLSNFSHNPNKVGYIYLLTPKGIEHKSRLTTSFLKTKIKEFEMLRDEITKLKLDAKEMAINK